MHFKTFACWLALVPGLACADSPRELYDKCIDLEQRAVSIARLLFDANNNVNQEKKTEFDTAITQQEDAEKQLQKLAATGDVEARYYIGMLEIHKGQVEIAMFTRNPYFLDKSQAGRENFQKAIGWLKPLAEQDLPAAQWQYGKLFANGWGVNASASNAIDWWYKAAIGYVRRHDREDALTLYDQMQKLDPENPLVLRVKQTLFAIPKK